MKVSIIEGNNPFLYEVSWEVCNRIGGIYTVLSTHAKQLGKQLGDRLCFIGPDIEKIYCSDQANPLFSEESTPLDAWRDQQQNTLYKVRTGRWNVPGSPLAVLVDFRAYYDMKNQIYAQMWDWYQVDSLHEYGDYSEACMFAYASGEVVKSLVEYQQARVQKQDVENQPEFVAHFHEWTCGMGLLYLKHFMPHVATVFTTHATSIGRSICGNGKALYDYLPGYQGDQMARELNMESKHSLEKTAAHQADCFTTVSDITAQECAQLLDKKPDVVTPNGFEDDFVPPAHKADKARAMARAKLLDVAEAMLGHDLPEDTLLIATAGRYEYRNKGLDVFIESLRLLKQKLQEESLNRPVVAYILVPGNVSAPRQEVLDRMNNLDDSSHLRYGRRVRQFANEMDMNVLPSKGAIYHPYNSHWMHYIEDDKVLNAIKAAGFGNSLNEKVKVIFVPCYLHGNDGIFNMNYYDLLQGFDLTAFLSYYEPWGYTPLESIAFSIPTLTTSLSGFGAWAAQINADAGNIAGGVAVINRYDGNYAEVAEKAAETYYHFWRMNFVETAQTRKKARAISRKAQWSKFIKYYWEAYRVALQRNYSNRKQ